MMILIAACLLAFLAFVNHRIGGSVFYPPVLFCFIWSIVLLLLWSFSALFYAVGSECIYIYVIGAVAYSVGSTLVWIVPKISSSPNFGSPGYNQRTGFAFVLLLISILGALPFLVLYTRTQAHSSSSDSFWEGVRSSNIDLDQVQGGGPITVASLGPLYLVLAFIAILELTANPHHRYRKTLFAFISCVFVFQLLLVDRADILLLLCGLVSIVSVYRRRVPLRTIVLSAIVFLSVFALNQFGLRKMDAEWSGRASERAAAVGRGFVIYAVSSLVGFDQVIRHPGHVQNTWKIYKPFVRIANKFGADLPELGQHLDFIEVAPGLEINTYTFYFTYYVDFGIGGVIVASVLFGGLSTAVFRMALAKSSMGAVLYPLVVFGVIMSTFAECVCQAMTLWAKAAVCAVFFYRILSSAQPSSISTSSDARHRLSAVRGIPAKCGSFRSRISR